MLFGKNARQLRKEEVLLPEQRLAATSPQARRLLPQVILCDDVDLERP